MTFVWFPEFAIWVALPGTANAIARGPGQFFTSRGIGDNRIWFWNGSAWFKSFEPWGAERTCSSGDGQWATNGLQVIVRRQ